MNSPPNHKWEQALDIDDLDLRLTVIVRPRNNPQILLETTTTTQTMFSSQNHQVDNCVVKPIRIIPGPAGPWLNVVEYVNVDGGIVTGCFGDVKKFLKNKKLKKVVVIIKSCTQNALGDLTITLKDLFGTISVLFITKCLRRRGLQRRLP
nr:hypothetical protein [Tanacetum cinerariifolium]